MVKIPNLIQPLLDSVGRKLLSVLKQLQVGQVLPAKVLSQPQPGMLQLRLGNAEVLARSEVSLPPGTSLRLEVTKGMPMPELRVLRPPTRQEIQQQVVRSAMGRQLPPAEVRETVTTLRTQAQTPQQAIAVDRLAEILRTSGIRLERLSPHEVERALADSGVFHEARLAGPPGPVASDLKTQLLQLANLLRVEIANLARPPQTPAPETQAPKAQTPTPPPPDVAPRPAAGPVAHETTGDALLQRLVRMVEGSASRIQLQQSVALPVDDSQRQVWQFDLPLHLRDTTDDLTVRIERERASRDGDGEPEWAIKLAFRFATIGSLDCRIALTGDRVATTFWCEQPDTHGRLEARLPDLREALAAQGLEVVHLAGVLGRPAEPLTPVPLPDSLVDERA